MNRRRSVSRRRGGARIIGALGLALAWLGAGVCQAGGQVTLPPVNLGSSGFLAGLAGPALALENAIRFLTDHLEGDVYFRVLRADHNLDRCRAQLRRVELLLEHLDAARADVQAADVSP